MREALEYMPIAPSAIAPSMMRPMAPTAPFSSFALRATAVPSIVQAALSTSRLPASASGLIQSITAARQSPPTVETSGRVLQLSSSDQRA